MGGGAPPGARASRPHPLHWVAAQFPRDAAPGHPAAGNPMGSAEAESWRRCRSSRVEETGEAVPVLCGRDARAPGWASARCAPASRPVHEALWVPYRQGQCLLVEQEGWEEAPLRERGRPARILCVGWPLSFPVMRHTATLPAANAWARLKRNPGAVAGRAGWKRWVKLCQCCAGGTPALPGGPPFAAHLLLVLIHKAIWSLIGRGSAFSRSKKEGRKPLRERGRLARILCVGWPLSFPVMRRPSTLPAANAWARLKRNPGAVAGRAGWKRRVRLCQCCAGGTPALPGGPPLAAHPLLVLFMRK